jgi:glycosyltransferase involved in cell wall biosynthesis
MKTINLLIDGTVIIDGLRNRKKNASGLFFVSLNLLKTFLDDARYDVSVYVSQRNYSQAWRIKQIFMPKKLKIITIQDKVEAIKNIDCHKHNIQASGHIFKKILFYLKILKNLLRLLRYKYFNNNSKIIKNFEAFLSPVYKIPHEIEKYLYVKRFIIIHDIIPLLKLSCYENYQFDEYHFIYDILDNLNHDYYFFVSENSKRDFIKYTGGCIDEKKLLVTHIASANNFVPQYDREKLSLVLRKYKTNFNSTNKYIFSFCSIEPRKNLLFTIKCFIAFLQKNKISDLYFFLGGAAWSNFKDLYKKEISNINSEYKDKIIHLGYIDNADVNILYSNSLFFVYISKYEGFGMPVLEAMQAGIPVITSNNSSMPEVVGDAAIMIDCDSEEQCIAAFETFYYNEKIRNDYIKRGIERAKLFTWEKTLNKMTEVIIPACRYMIYGDT